MNYPRTIKSYSTRSFSVELAEVQENGYVVTFEQGNERSTTGVMKDLKNAMMWFDDTILMLEGN